MATWSLSPEYKKNAVEKMFFYKEGKVITMEQGYRWATFKVESDTRPLTTEELKNEDGYELASIDNDESWEMWDMMDGCWMDVEGGAGVTDEELEAFNNAWEEEFYEGVEALGWSQDDTEYYYYGPLKLTNEDTGEEFSVLDENGNIIHDVVDEVTEEVDIEWPEVTDWFDVSVNPVREGVYQVVNKEAVAWPFPSYSQWDGEKWESSSVIKWRGLAKEPTKE